MKKFKFSLGKMLDFKDQILEEEKNKLGQLRTRKQAVDNKIDDLERDFSDLNEEFKKKTGEGVTVYQIRMYEYQMDNIRMHIRDLRGQQRALAVAVENQLQVVITASQEVSGLDKLREKQLEEYNYMVQKADEAIIAEFVTSKIVREAAANGI